MYNFYRDRSREVNEKQHFVCRGDMIVGTLIKQQYIFQRNSEDAKYSTYSYDYFTVFISNDMKS